MATKKTKSAKKAKPSVSKKVKVTAPNDCITLIVATTPKKKPIVRKSTLIVVGVIVVLVVLLLVL